MRRAIDDCDARPPHLIVTRQAVQFNPLSDHWLDVRAFGELIETCKEHTHRRLDLCTPCMDRLHQAVDLYRGSFLEGLSPDESLPFEEWLLLQQERWHRLAAEALRVLAACHERRGEYRQVLRYARRHVELEPWREGAHRQIMRALVAAGQRSAALTQYETCRRVLQAELGVEPEEATSRLYEDIRSGRAGFSTSDALPHNLPAPLTLFVGREGELAAVKARLRDPACRLLTLIGPGGIGKTRLALETGEDILAGEIGWDEEAALFRQGIYFGSLAHLQSPDALLPALAEGVGLTFSREGQSPRFPPIPKQQLLDYLRRRSLLLILDGFEHLLEGVVLVSEVLRTAPGVKVLVTSRSVLHVQGEHQILLSGLNYAGDPSIEHAIQYGAVRLFTDRARRARPDFELTSDNIVDVLRICRLVEGMPLALLLAAAWLEMLTPAEIAAEVERSLDFLASDLHDVPQRQRSMRAVFEHSWNLLSEHERAVMQVLSVFRGGFTRKAAQEVARASLNDLMSLIDRSLLHRTAGGQYEIHELLRQYAAEKLDRAPGAKRAACDDHCAYYAAALARWAAGLKGSRQQEAMAEIEIDIENARAAWEWAAGRVQECGQVERLDQAMEGLGRFYELQACYEEGESTFRMAADRLAERTHSVRRTHTVRCPTPRGSTNGSPGTSGSHLVVRARALTWQSYFCRRLGCSELARELLRQSLDLLGASAPADTRRARAFALYVMGEIEGGSGNRENARQLYSRSLALYRALDQPWEMAETLSALADVAQGMGEFDEAKTLCQEGLAIRRKLGDQRGLARQLLGGLAVTLQSLGQFEECEQLKREGLAIARDIGDRSLICVGLWQVAATLMWKGEFDKSRLLLEEGLRTCTDLGAGLYWAYYASQRSLGLTLAHLGHYREARVHLQRALALARKANSLWVIGTALLGLGLVALAEGNCAGARQHLQNGLAVIQGMGQRCNVGWFLAALAGAARGLGQSPDAQKCLCEALQISVEIRAVLTPIMALPVAALLLADMGQTERAVEVYALALRYPRVANSRQWEDIAGREIAALAATLPPEVVAAAQERGRARDLWATVEELLAEWQKMPCSPNA